MTKRESHTIAEKTFKTKKEINEYTEELIESLGVCDIVTGHKDFPFFSALFQRKPSHRTIKEKIVKFKIRLCPITGRKANHMVFVDEHKKEKSFSWRKCCDGVDTTDSEMLQGALRECTALQTTRSWYKQQECAECGKRKEVGFEIDHVNEFANMYQDFLKQNVLPIPTAFAKAEKSRRFTFRAEDSKFKESFQAYHAKHAILSLLCKECHRDKTNAFASSRASERQTHFFMGALNKETSKYENPKWASKKNDYTCPDCDNYVILRQGKINRPHFAHKTSTHPCYYYDKPSEAQIHKDAKEALKNILERGEEITIERKCGNIDCKVKDIFEIPKVSETSSIVLEHRFTYNGTKIADVAYLDSDEVLAIFEILNTSVTKEERRPDDWFELKAIDVINADFLSFHCQRHVLCETCNKQTSEEEKRNENERKRDAEIRNANESKRRRELEISNAREEARRQHAKIQTIEELMDRERRDQLRKDNPDDYDSDYEQDYRIPKRC